MAEKTYVDIGSASHSQQAEIAAAFGVSADTTALQSQLDEAHAEIEALTASLSREQELRGDVEHELNAEKEAHAATQAALDAATKTTEQQ